MKRVVAIFIVSLLSISFSGCVDTNKYFIHDNLGNVWEPTGSNLVIAFNSLQENGELWLPYHDTITVTNNLCISKPGVKIHGRGSTIIFLNESRLISSANPYTGSDTLRLAKGLDNIQLDSFTFTGEGQLEIVLGNNTVLYNVNSENTVCKKRGDFKFVTPSTVTKVSGLTVTNCHAYKSWWHGFIIVSTFSTVCEVSNVLFDRCTSEYAGYEYEGREPRNDNNGNWSVGFDVAEGGSLLTVKNVIVRNCISEYSWESGFHMENAPTKINVVFENCKSNYNGQKCEYMDTTGKTYYCSGFTVDSPGITLKNCEANNNTKYGFSLGGTPILINPMGIGNWISLCNKGC